MQEVLQSSISFGALAREPPEVFQKGTQHNVRIFDHQEIDISEVHNLSPNV